MQCKQNRTAMPKNNIIAQQTAMQKQMPPHPKQAHPAPAKSKKPQMQKKLHCKDNCNAKIIATKVVHRRPVKDLIPHPKPAHPATVKLKKLQMQKKLQCNTKCNAKIIAETVVCRRLVKAFTPNPKPADTAPTKPKKPRMQKKCNAKQTALQKKLQRESSVVVWSGN